MLDPRAFLDTLQQHKVSFFAGVPDSLLKNFCACVDDVLPKEQHIITANEGGAVAVATGYHLATGKIPVVYMQNSGLGNTVNPILSLADSSVYGIPMLLVIGWRGEPGVADEPQHAKQGPITPPLLTCMDIPYAVLPDTEPESREVLEQALAHIDEHQAPYALLVRKGTFDTYSAMKQPVAKGMTREEALTIVLDTFPGAVFVGTTGKLSRELFELREQRGEGHEQDFLTVGSMGHASQIALGIAEARPNKTVVCLDGDGAALMHLGGLATIGARSPQNFVHIIFNNGVHESVGGQLVTGQNVDYGAIAKGLGYKKVEKVSDKEALKMLDTDSRPILIDCVIKPGSRDDLGRPTSTPKENKDSFKKFLSQ